MFSAARALLDQGFVYIQHQLQPNRNRFYQHSSRYLHLVGPDPTAHWLERDKHVYPDGHSY